MYSCTCVNFKMHFGSGSKIKVYFMYKSEMKITNHLFTPDGVKQLFFINVKNITVGAHIEGVGI